MASSVYKKWLESEFHPKLSGCQNPYFSPQYHTLSIQADDLASESGQYMEIERRSSVSYFWYCTEYRHELESWVEETEGSGIMSHFYSGD